ncbi:unnamed protein product [Sphenostylis stenocarpa]|uniref:Protein RFT1 homolog n=1 Tax=Sphenostylis stenocarpa TaxID=92480 RepID=A0AA86S0F0_9FABA|nr:unnamed protein product [Sphenostylis stenocarpa]
MVVTEKQNDDCENGTSEAFMHAVATESQLKRSNDSLLIFSLIYIIFNVLLIRLAGAVGLIMANSLTIAGKKLSSEESFALMIMWTKDFCNIIKLGAEKLNGKWFEEGICGDIYWFVFADSSESWVIERVRHVMGSKSEALQYPSQRTAQNQGSHVMKFLEQKERYHQNELCGDVRGSKPVAVPKPTCVVCHQVHK